MKSTKTPAYYLAGSVALITFILYLSSLGNEFVNWDDNAYVYENTYIRSFDLTFFKWAFFDFYASNWHPLTWISHALDYAVWGLDPLGHHLTNNILHAVNTFLVVLLMVKLMEAVNPTSLLNSPHPPLKLRGGAEGGGVISRGFSDKGTLIAATTTGLLFGIHPIHVESVAWVAERKDLLCALFFLLSIMMYIKYVGNSFLSFPLVGNLSAPGLNTGKDSGQAGMTGLRLRFFDKHYLLCLLFFTLALLSKPMAVSLPVVFLILDWYPFARITTFKTFKIALIEKLPFIALSIGSSILTMLAQKAGGSVSAIEYIPMSTRIPVAAKSLIVYLWKMLLPLQLVPFYPYPEDASLLSAEYLSPILLAVLITVLCIIMAKKQKLLLAVWSYYAVMLIPVLGIIQVGRQAMADRYTYLPGLGLFLIAGLLVASVSIKASAIKKSWQFVKVANVAVAVLAVVSLSVLTYGQISIWKNSITLWSCIIEHEPDKVSIAYLNRGAAFQETGQLNRAIEDYDKALALEPFSPDIYNNRGVVFGQMRQFDKAIADYNWAITLLQNGAVSNVPDGRKLYHLNRGRAYIEIGQYNLAVSDFKKACDLGSTEGCNALRYFQQQ